MDKIFGIKDSDESQIIDNLKATGSDYLYNCYVKYNKIILSSETSNFDINEYGECLLNYHKLYLSGDIISNKESCITDYLHYMTETYCKNYLWKELTNHCTDSEIIDYLKEFLPICNKHKQKYIILKYLFEPLRVLATFKNYPFYDSRNENEEKGLLSYFLSNIPLKLDLTKSNLLLDNVYNSMKFILSNENAFSDMILLMRKNLLQHISTEYAEILNPQSMTGIEFISNMFKLIARMWKLFDNKLECTFHVREKHENNFEIYDDDSHNIKLIILVGLAIHICYCSIYRKYHIIENDLILVDEGIQQYNNQLQQSVLLASRHKIVSRLETLGKIVNSSRINTFINDYFCKIIELTSCKKYYVNDDTISDLLCFITHIAHSSEIYNVDKKIINFLVDIFGSACYTKNPHLRYDCANIIHNIINKESPYYVSDKSIPAVIKYIGEIDIFHLSKPSTVHKHYINLLDSLNNLLQVYKYDFSGFNDMKLLYKSFKEMYEVIDDLTGVSKSIAKENLTGLRLQEYERKYNNSISIEFEFVEKNIVFLNFLLSNKYLLLKNLTQETLNMIMLSTIYTLTFFSNKKDKLIYIYTKHTNQIKIIKSIFKLYILCENYPEFNLYFTNKIKVLMNASDLLSSYKLLVDTSEISTINAFVGKMFHIDNINDINSCITKNNSLKVPDEFLDPILCCPIKTPIMIPEVVDTIFDKSSIMTQLLNTPINPYTRSPLTPEMLDEYNNTDEVKRKINTFIEKFTKWKESVENDPQKKILDDKKNIS